MQPTNSAPVFGVVLPPNIASTWLNVSVTVTESGGKIILESGAKPLQLSRKDIIKTTEILSRIKI